MSRYDEEQNYRIFLAKLIRQLNTAAYLLGYCIMPNHFHLLLIPKHPLRENYPLDDDYHSIVPSDALSQAMQRLQMGVLTAGYKRFTLLYYPGSYGGVYPQ
jgi:hypothetical protein